MAGTAETAAPQPDTPPRPDATAAPGPPARRPAGLDPPGRAARLKYPPNVQTYQTRMGYLLRCKQRVIDAYNLAGVWAIEGLTRDQYYRGGTLEDGRRFTGMPAALQARFRWRYRCTTPQAQQLRELAMERLKLVDGALVDLADTLRASDHHDPDVEALLWS